MLNFDFNEKTQYFDISSSGEPMIMISILDIINNTYKTNISKNIFSMHVDNDMEISVFNNQNYIEFVVLCNDFKNINVKFQNVTNNIKNSSNTLLETSKGSMYFTVADGTLDTITNSEANISIAKNEIRFFISNEPINIKALSKPLSTNQELIFRTFTSTLSRMSITNGESIPEFAVTLYEDEEHTRPLPMYNGNPVLSNINSSDSINTNGDYWLQNIGVGSENKQIYVEIEASKMINVPVNYTPYMGITTPMFRIIKISNQEVLISQSLTVDTNSKIINTSFTSQKSWGDNEILLIDIYLNMYIESGLALQFQYGNPPTRTAQTNIFSVDSE